MYHAGWHHFNIKPNRDNRGKAFGCSVFTCVSTRVGTGGQRRNQRTPSAVGRKLWLGAHVNQGGDQRQIQTQIQRQRQRHSQLGSHEIKGSDQSEEAKVFFEILVSIAS